MQLTSQDDLPIFREIHAQTDRGAAIIAVGFVETKLHDAIKACLKDDNEVVSNLLKGRGPLGPFSHRIDIAYLLGLYRDETRQDFHRIREIRNKFAHDPLPIDFGDDYIRYRCDALTVIDRCWPQDMAGIRQERPLDRERARNEFLSSLSQLWTFLNHQAQHEEFRTRAADLLPY